MSWEELATFVAKSARPPFTRRLLVLLGEAFLGRTAREELPADVAVWDMSGIMTAEGGALWPATHSQVLTQLGHSQQLRPAPKQPRPHQRQAVADVLDQFASAQRAQLVMACGTGKMVAAHAIAAGCGANRVLVLAPSLALLKQLIEAFGWQYDGRMRAIVVCSDETVVRGSSQGDVVVVTASELPLRRTSDPIALANF